MKKIALVTIPLLLFATSAVALAQGNHTGFFSTSAADLTMTPMVTVVANATMTSTPMATAATASPIATEIATATPAVTQVATTSPTATSAATEMATETPVATTAAVTPVVTASATALPVTGGPGLPVASAIALGAAAIGCGFFLRRRPPTS